MRSEERARIRAERAERAAKETLTAILKAKLTSVEAWREAIEVATEAVAAVTIAEKAARQVIVLKANLKWMEEERLTATEATITAQKAWVEAWTESEKIQVAKGEEKSIAARAARRAEKKARRADEKARESEGRIREMMEEWNGRKD